MKHDLFIHRTIVVASLVLFPLIVPVVTLAEQPEDRAKTFSEKQVPGLKQIAADSTRDTLKACLGRIPLDASARQLMLAEQNCQQVEADRGKVQLSF